MRKSLIIAQIKCKILRFLSQESETPLLILSLSKCLEQYHMIDSGIYLLQVQVRKIRNAIITAGNYIITLRVGKNSSSSNFVRTGSDKQVQVSAFLQMNVDKSALQAQRCSLSVTSEDKKMIGLALVSIPQETTTLSNTYKLTQNEDKRAQIDLKLKISPFEEIKIQINRVKQQQLEQNRNQKKLSMNQAKDNNGLISKMGLNFSKIDCLPSYINLKSKISDEASHISSEQRPNLKNFKLIEQSKIIQVSQSEIKRFRDEKQVYYQLYQIQKTKSEIALKFINTITKKLVIKYPSLAQQDQPKIFAIEQRKSTKQNSSHQKQNNQAQIQQLQQANRSLHRQVQQYKKIVQQLKEEMHRLLTKGQNKKVNNLSKQNKILPDFLDLSFSRAEKERSPRNHRDNHPQQSITDSIKGINLEKWLQASIGERKALQAMFITIEPHLASTQPPKDKILLTKIKQQLLQKLKSKMDKEFISLLKSKQFNKQILINHRRQLNKLLQQCFLQ